MDFVAAQKVSKELFRRFGKERWYRGVGLRVKPSHVLVELAVDPMCKDLAKEVVPTQIDGVTIVLTT